MPKKTPDEFKQAFKAIKKPKRPSKGVGKLKDVLEKAVGDEDSDAFVKNIDLIAKADRGYLIDLVAYKLGKHLENTDKRPFWQEKVPPDIMKAAVAKIVPDDLSTPTGAKAFEKALKDGKTADVALLFARDPVRAEQFLFDQATTLTGKENAGNRAMCMIAAASCGIDVVAFNKRVLKGALAAGNDDAATEFGKLLSGLGEDEIVDIATSNPALFFSKTLQGFKDRGSEFITMLGKKSLRDKLSVLNPGAWATFVAGTPMLAALVTVEQQVVDDGLVGSSAIMNAVFDAVLDPTKMQITYSATAVDSNHSIMVGFTDTTTGMREAQKKQGILEVFPDLPATDCHHSLYIMEQMMKLYPGFTPEIHNVNAPEMLMTEPLGTIPGRGTLDRGFPGNVFLENGTPTGRVLFTGDDNGKNSHTWLSVDGEMFDPVMGTKGDDVAGAIGYQPTWIIYKRLANCNEDNLYAVMDKSLKPAANAMGFSTGYYLTDDPAKYLTEDEIKQAGLG
jgi:hypothetical protein